MVPLKKSLPQEVPPLAQGASYPALQDGGPTTSAREGGLRQSNRPSCLAWLLTLVAGVVVGKGWWGYECRWGGGGQGLARLWMPEAGGGLLSQLHATLLSSRQFSSWPPPPPHPCDFSVGAQMCLALLEMPCHQVSIRTHTGYHRIKVDTTAMRIWRWVSSPCALRADGGGIEPCLGCWGKDPESQNLAGIASCHPQQCHSSCPFLLSQNIHANAVINSPEEWTKGVTGN